MFIDGIAIADFRSFGRPIQKIGPFSKINLLIGQNNSGKSNVLSYIQDCYPIALQSFDDRRIYLNHTDLNRHIGSSHSDLQFGVGIKIGSQLCNRLIASLNENDRQRDKLGDQIDRILRSNAMNQGTDIAWFLFQGSANNEIKVIPSEVQRVIRDASFNSHEWAVAFRIDKNSTKWGQVNADNLSNLFTSFCKVALPKPDIATIPAFRRIDNSTNSNEGFNGSGLIEQLVQLQNPDYNHRHDRVRFDRINKFVQDVVGNTTAHLEIPHSRKEILVHIDDRPLPLSSLGTGIHEVIILAAAATVHEEHVVCMEEPELHLHPTLQRKLLRYLHDNTSNQYFITTHSAHFLDVCESSIFHIRYIDGQSQVEAAISSSQKFTICRDLGYRASDILQANCVIWVEGPSDRIYIRHWIKELNPDLIEGIHYSIMFYGGRLLSHLSADDAEVSEFISLRRLNRYSAIVIDSDKASSNAHLNATKKRIEAEFNQPPGYVWITKGREIENYLNSSNLRTVIQNIYPRAIRLAGDGPYDHVIHFYQSIPKRRKATNVSGEELCKDPDKVKIAHAMIAHPTDWDRLNLKQSMEGLVNFIQESNQSSPTIPIVS